MGKYKIDDTLDTHDWNIDELPKKPTPILAECLVCGLQLRAHTDRDAYGYHEYEPFPDPDDHVAIPIKPKQLDCSHCQKTIMVPIIMRT